VKDIAGTGKKRYLALRIVDSPVEASGDTFGLAETTVVYELDFSDVTLEETEYDISIEDTSAVTKPHLYKAGQAAGVNPAVTLTATVTDSEGKPAPHVNVKWGSSSELAMISSISGGGFTDAEGKITANVEINVTNPDAAIATITAVAGGSGMASESFELYEARKIIEGGAEGFTMTLPGQQEYALTPTFELALGSSYGIEWAPADDGTSNAASVDSYGVVTAFNPGNVKFVQKIVDSKGVVLAVSGDEESVYNGRITTAIERVWIEQTGDVYANNKNNTTALIVKTYPEKTEGLIYRWSSSNNSTTNPTKPAADIAGDGIIPTVTGKNKGTTTITVTVKDGENVYNATKVLRVRPTVDKVEIFEQGYPEFADEEILVSANKGSKVNLIAEAKASDPDADTSITWSISDETYATVDQNGQVTTFFPGNVDVYATAPDGKQAIAHLAIYDVVTTLSADASNIAIGAGETVKVKIYADPAAAVLGIIPSYDSKYVNVAEELGGDSQFNITGVSKGKTTVIFTEVGSGLTTEVAVNVGGKTTALTSLTTDVDNYELYFGKSAQLTYKATPKDYNNVALVWSTLSDKIIVSPTGEVSVKATTAVGEEATVTLTAYKLDGTPAGKSVDYTIKVVAQPKAKSVVIEPRSLTLKAPFDGTPGESACLTAKVYPDNAFDKSIVWSVAGDAVDIDADGFVTAVHKGSAIVRAQSAEAGVYKEIVVNVVEAVDSDDYATGRYREDAIWIGAIEEYTYTGMAIKPEPNVYFGDVLLTPGVDYKLSWKNNTDASRAKKNESQPKIYAEGKGNYAGKAEASFAIYPASLSDVTVNNVSAVTKTGKGGYQEQFLAPTLTYNGKALKYLKDFDLDYPDTWDVGAYESPGYWPIDITGMGNFTGYAYADEILVDKAMALNISKATVTGLEKQYFYDGEPICPELTVKYKVDKTKEIRLVEGEDYDVTYDNNVALGTATILITGKMSSSGDFYGNKKLTFKIVPVVTDISKTAANKLVVAINGVDIDVTAGKGNGTNLVSVPFLKGGAKPSSVDVWCDGYGYLKEGADFTWTSKAKDDLGTVTVNGKGSFFKGKAEVTFKIDKQDIEEVIIVADDAEYAAKAGFYDKAKITLYDLDGKTLAKGKDYSLEFSTDDGTSIPSIGACVNVTIKGEGMYNGETTTSIRVIDKAKRLSTASFAFMDNDNDEEIAAGKFFVKYAGSPVTLTEDDIVLKVKRKVGRLNKTVRLETTEYEIVTILNNNKVGTATVILKGTGEFGGLKNITFKIKK
ncbi:MAG: Ig-like domain-containing protein, partial [Lachnospiraceae bacterium]|nr:Ig-like domain-containing protein [Lachnospiraceae bacterium]